MQGREDRGGGQWTFAWKPLWTVPLSAMAHPMLSVSCQVPQVQYVEKIVEVPEVRVQEARAQGFCLAVRINKCIALCFVPSHLVRVGR